MKLLRRKRFKRFWLRLTIALPMLFRKRHFVVIYITEEDLIEMVNNDTLKTDEVEWSYAGMSIHVAQRLVKIMADGIDEAEIICNKATWTAAALELLEKQKPNDKTD